MRFFRMSFAIAAVCESSSPAAASSGTFWSALLIAARWPPSGANVQCWDFIVVDEPSMRDRVMDVFLRQAQRLVDHAKGFPAVKKTYLAIPSRLSSSWAIRAGRPASPWAPPRNGIPSIAQTGYLPFFAWGCGTEHPTRYGGAGPDVGVTVRWGNETNRELAEVLGYQLG